MQSFTINVEDGPILSLSEDEEEPDKGFDSRSYGRVSPEPHSPATPLTPVEYNYSVLSVLLPVVFMPYLFINIRKTLFINNYCLHLHTLSTESHQNRTCVATRITMHTMPPLLHKPRSPR